MRPKETQTPTRNRFLNLMELAIARHMGPRCKKIHAAQRLHEDLGLDPLDVILIVIRLEEQAGVEFPVGSLDRVRTVRDLAEAIRDWQPQLSADLSA